MDNLLTDYIYEGFHTMNTPLPPTLHWNLKDLYESPDSDSVDKDFVWIDEACRDFAKRFEGKLAGLTGDALAGALAEYETIQCRIGRLTLYAHLKYEQGELHDNETEKPYDNGMEKPPPDPAFEFYTDVNARLRDLSRPLVFFPLEFNRIDDTTLASRCDDSPDRVRYRTWIDRQRAQRDHQLPNQLEEYIHDTSLISTQSWIELFDETIDNFSCDMDLDDEDLDDKGGFQQISLKQVLARGGHSCRNSRHDAANTAAVALSTQGRLLAYIYNILIKTQEINDRWRKFPTPQSFCHLKNNIEPEIVQALRDTVVEAYPRISHRYYAMKARWLGLERLEFWDWRAPLPESNNPPIGWDEARGIVLDAFQAFSPVFGAEAERFFDEGWIEVRKVKSRKGFSIPGPAELHPYVCLHYWDQFDNVVTLAHELGHGVHQSLAAEPHAGQPHSTPRTFAETASAFGEMLVFRKLLDEETDRAARRTLLVNMAGAMISTVAHTICIYEFESRIHAARREGELQIEDFRRIWMETEGERLGPAVHLSKQYEDFWCTSVNLNRPFDTYAYAFGQGLVCALYGLYRREPEGFAEKYINMLRAGGSLHHKEMLAPFGLDLRDPDFWKIGIDVIAGILDEIEALEDS